MNAKLLIVLILIAASCIDRLDFSTVTSTGGTLVVEGFISDQKRPHQVKIYKSYPVGRIDSIRATPFSAHDVSIEDENGQTEQLTESAAGIYQTRPDFQGRVGGIYKLKIEFSDGLAFESLPDTIQYSGDLDSAYYSFNKTVDYSGRPTFSLDVLADATLLGKGGRYYMWTTISTYKVVTDPTCDINQSCNFNYSRNVCNWVPLCSGLVNIGTTRFPKFERQAPCTCCVCWYNIFTEKPIINSEIALENISALKVGSVPINPFTFMFKTHVEVQQKSVSKNTYRFWTAVLKQKEGAASLFQPASGKIPTNFRQVSGEPTKISGLFYVVGLRTKSFYILRDDITLTPVPRADTVCAVCSYLLPNSSTVKPRFWVD